MDYNFTDATETPGKDYRLWWCFVLPFCNTTGCDMTNTRSPAACEGCSVGVIALLLLVLFFMAVFIILGNTGIILVILKNPIFHNPFNLFKCSLAVADLLVGLLVLPGGVAETIIILILPYDQEKVNSSDYIMDGDGTLLDPDSVCARMHREEHSSVGFFFSIVGVLSIMASIFNLVLLSVDRFLAVRCPIKYNQGRAINNRMAGLFVLIVWVMSVILSAIVPVAMGESYFKYGLTSAMIFTLKTMDSYAGFFYAVFAIGLPYFLLVVLNISTVVLLFKKRRKFTRATSLKGPTKAKVANGAGSKRRSEVKATVTLFVMVAVFTVSTMPALITVTLFNDQKTNNEYVDGHTEGVAYMILTLLLVSNSAWNFIIYSWRNENFRKALKRLLGGRRKSHRVSWSRVRSTMKKNNTNGEQCYANCGESKMNIKTVNKRFDGMPLSEMQHNMQLSRETSSSGQTSHQRLTLTTSASSTVSGSLVGSITRGSLYHSVSDNGQTPFGSSIEEFGKSTAKSDRLEISSSCISEENTTSDAQICNENSGDNSPTINVKEEANTEALFNSSTEKDSVETTEKTDIPIVA